MTIQGRRKLMAILILAGIAQFWLLGCNVVDYTGDHLAPTGRLTLCGEVRDDETGMLVPYTPVEFQAETLWGGKPLIPSGTTNVVGEICVKPRWPADVYRVSPVDTGMYGGDPIPTAVTVYGSRWTGVFAGGAISLGAATGVLRPGVQREATFGVIYRTDQTDPRTARLLFLDPLNPEGPVEIRAQNFDLEQNGEVLLSGPCTFISDGITAVSSRFEAALTGGTNPTLTIRVFAYPDTVLYEATGGIHDGGVLIKELI